MTGLRLKCPSSSLQTWTSSWISATEVKLAYVVKSFEESGPPPEPSSENYEDDPEGYRRAMRRWKEVRAFMDAEGTQEKNFPVVPFHHGEQTHIILSHCYISESGVAAPQSLLMRTRIPLAPGWAMTTHKSQSLSLDHRRQPIECSRVGASLRRPCSGQMPGRSQDRRG
ncbi:hypothetical protein BJ170DRAFT_86973 [Xylariales sp. AK1849]|nr:hypothetical protein BJ170DRAFT_86973 [Xylariales sp. AK1849]